MFKVSFYGDRGLDTYGSLKACVDKWYNDDDCEKQADSFSRWTQTN